MLSPTHHAAAFPLRGGTTALPNRWKDSFSVTVLLSTSAPGLLSGSTAKYPSRSSWNLHVSLQRYQHFSAETRCLPNSLIHARQNLHMGFVQCVSRSLCSLAWCRVTSNRL